MNQKRLTRWFELVQRLKFLSADELRFSIRDLEDRFKNGWQVAMQEGYNAGMEKARTEYMTSQQRNWMQPQSASSPSSIPDNKSGAGISNAPTAGVPMANTGMNMGGNGGRPQTQQQPPAQPMNPTPSNVNTTTTMTAMTKG
jgi:hypothetical protein